MRFILIEKIAFKILNQLMMIVWALSEWLLSNVSYNLKTFSELQAQSGKIIRLHEIEWMYTIPIKIYT